MAGNGRNQWPPYTETGPSRQAEQIAVRIEQPQPTGSMIVTSWQQSRIVTEACRIMARYLCLKLLGELAYVVQAEKEANQTDCLFPSEPEQES